MTKKDAAGGHVHELGVITSGEPAGRVELQRKRSNGRSSSSRVGSTGRRRRRPGGGAVLDSERRLYELFTSPTIF